MRQGGDLNIKKVLSQKFIANRFILMDIVKEARKRDAHKWRVLVTDPKIVFLTRKSITE